MNINNINYKCPMCGNRWISVERRMNGDAICDKCFHRAPAVEFVMKGDTKLEEPSSDTDIKYLIVKLDPGQNSHHVECIMNDISMISGVDSVDNFTDDFTDDSNDLINKSELKNKLENFIKDNLGELSNEYTRINIRNYI